MSSKPKTKPPWKKIYAALPFVCKYCRGLFPDFKFYRRHIRSHESRYKKFWQSREWRAARRYSTSWVEDVSETGHCESWQNCCDGRGSAATFSNIIKFAGKRSNGGSGGQVEINGCEINGAARRVVRRRATTTNKFNFPLGITLEQAALIAHYQRMQLSKHKAPERYSDSEDCSDSNHSNGGSHDATLHDLGQLLSGRQAAQQLEQCMCNDCCKPTHHTTEEPIMPSYQHRHSLDKHPGDRDEYRNRSNSSPPTSTDAYTYRNSMGPVMLPCPHCPVSFDHADRLTLHIKNHYTGNKTAVTPVTPCDTDEQGTEKIDSVGPGGTGYDLEPQQQFSTTTPHPNMDTNPPNMDTDPSVMNTDPSPVDNNPSAIIPSNVSNNNNGGLGYRGDQLALTDKVDQLIMKCHDCNEAFSSDTEFKVHQKYHQTVTKGYQSVTRKHSSTAAAYLAAGDDHSSPPKPYPCVYCPKTFSYWSSLKTHEFSHTGQTPFACNMCDEKFMQCSELKLHEKTHLGTNPFKCNKCDRLFKHRPSLTSHERAHHGEDGKNICPVCLKTFSVGSNLRDHLRIHTGERPYQCASCGRGFIQKSHLRKHVMIHTGERPFRCTFCNKGFTQRGDVRRHEKIHRKVK